MEMATLGIPSPAAKLTPRFSFRLRARNLTFRVRCSAEAAPGTATEEEGSVTPSRLPNSLISAANVQKALRGVAITEVDHYGRLGISRGTSYDQVIVAYEKKCQELMNKDLDEEEMKEELELLKESYAILSSEDERRLYDWSLSRSERPDRYVWPFEVDITQTPKGTPPPQEPEDVGPTRLVGYFLLAWLVLSVVLSITLNIQ